MKNKFPRETLLKHCKDIKEFLDENYKDFYQSIEIVGSLRRGLEECGDIDLLLVPKYTKESALFGDPEEIPLTDNIDWSRYAKVIKRGDKYVQLELKVGPHRLNIDIYICTEAYKYGVLKVIRTGPESFNRKYCICRSLGGILPAGMYISDLTLTLDGTICPCYTEEDYFKAIGVDYIQPKNRK